MMTPAPKRRWFSFSLRTLFVVVTVLCVWLGWNVNLVRERKREMAEIMAESLARRGALAATHYPGAPFCDKEFVHRSQASAKRLSMIRRWLEDKVAGPDIMRKTESDAIRTARLFPESDVSYLAGLSHIPAGWHSKLEAAFLGLGQSSR